MSKREIYKRVPITDVLSHPDVMAVSDPVHKMLLLDCDKLFTERVLRSLGLDTTRPYDRCEGLVRMSNHSTIMGMIWSGFERTDESWVSTGNASEEVELMFRSKIVQSMDNL